MNTRRDFWLSCGHHLLDRDDDGFVLVTEEFLRTYLARPEVVPPADASPAEQALHRKLLLDPRAPIAAAEVAAVTDDEARENWQILIPWRDFLVRHRTLEAAYLGIVREGQRFPSLFQDQIVQVILRNLLDDCGDAFVLRAVEVFFRPQKLAVHGGSLLAVDVETFSAAPQPSPLASLLGLAAPEPGADVLNADNAAAYWDRSDMFDLALDLTAGRRGLAALGEVATRWIRHLLEVEVEIEALTEVRDIALTWYVGLDSNATRMGDALWHGETQPQDDFLVGLYRLTFVDDAGVIERMRGAPTYLRIAGASDMTLRLKPQNLVTGLPLRQATEVVR
ncbi:MAG TPA: DUF6352 family protein [Steroidobacteraceae bacterium]